LAPLCVRALGDATYLIPTNVRELHLLFANGDNFALIGGFTGRFEHIDFLRYWAGVSSLVTVMPPAVTRRLGMIESNRLGLSQSKRLIRLLDVLAGIDDRLEPIGFSSYLSSGVLIAVSVIVAETALFAALI
jgi:hypothetical protein